MLKALHAATVIISTALLLNKIVKEMMKQLCQQTHLSVVKEEMRHFKIPPDSVAGNQPAPLTVVPWYEDVLISQTCWNLGGLEVVNSWVLQSLSNTCSHHCCTHQWQSRQNANNAQFKRPFAEGCSRYSGPSLCHSSIQNTSVTAAKSNILLQPNKGKKMLPFAVDLRNKWDRKDVKFMTELLDVFSSCRESVASQPLEIWHLVLYPFSLACLWEWHRKQTDSHNKLHFPVTLQETFSPS